MTFPMVMGLDQSITNTCAVVAGHVTRIATKPKDFVHKLERLAHIGDRFSSLLGRLPRADRRVAYVEGYGFGSQVAHSLGELGGMLQLLLWEDGWEVYLVPPSTVKKFVTGKGNAEKSAMMLEVFKRWSYSAEDDNDADAFALYAFGVMHQRALHGLHDPLDERLRALPTKGQAECFGKAARLAAKGAR